MVTYGPAGNQPKRSARQLIWELPRDVPAPPNLYDTGVIPKCVNPAHLTDKVSRRAMPAAKLTLQDAEEIRALLRQGHLTHAEIAQQFGTISRPTVSMIAEERIWRPERIQGESIQTNQYDDYSTQPGERLVYEMIEKDQLRPLREVARMIGLSNSTLRRLCRENRITCEKRGKSWYVLPKDVQKMK